MTFEGNPLHASLFEHVPNAVLIHTQDEILQVNQAGAQLFGADRPAELTGASPWRFIPATHREAMQRRMQETVDQGFVELQRAQLLDLNGDMIDVEVTATSVTYEGKSAIQAIIQDRSAREETERQLRQSLDWFEAIFEGSRDAIFISDAHGRLVSVNGAACALTGYTRNELVRMRIPDLHAEVDLHAYRGYHDRILAGEGHTTRAQVLRKDGRKIDTEFSNRRVEIDGEPYVHTVARDLTERQRTEQALEESQAQFRAVFENAPTGIALVGEDGRIRRCNAALQNLLGYSESGLHGKHFAEVTHPDDRETDLAEFQKLLESNESDYRMEKRYVRYDRETIWGQLTVSVVRDARGRPQYAVGMVEDITERKRVEATLRDNEASFRLLFANNPLPMWVYDKATLQFLEVNDAAVDNYGYTREEFLGMTIRDIRPTEDVPALDHHLQRGLPSITPQSLWRHQRKDGQIIDVEITSHDLRFEDRAARLVVAQDVTDREEALQALAESERKYRQLFESSKDAIYIVDEEGRLTDVNQAAAAMIGATPEELIGRASDVFQVPLEDRRRFQREMEARGFVQDVELRMQRQDGSPLHCQVTATVRRDAEGRVIGHQGIVRDITEEKRLQAQLDYLANHDPLTGLFNRHRFETELERHLDRQSETKGALLWIDLDQLKAYNDSFGHQVGDELIGDIADLLRETLRSDDVLARLGGDEFAVLCPETTCKQAEAVAQKILYAIEEYALIVAGQPLHATASLGIACFPQHGLTVDEIMTTADLAMYEAKSDGRNRWRVYTPEDEEQPGEFASTVGWAERIRQGLEHDHFELHAQKVYDLQRDRVHGCELLLRLTDTEIPVVPGAFLQTAERFGLMEDVDRWVIANAIRQAAEYHRAGWRVYFEVNLSGQAVGNDTVSKQIEREVAEAGIDPHYLTFEITETAAITRLYEAKRFIQRLKELGCKFALDDFGVGFSSFYHLKHLPVDYLKIDGSFIRSLADDMTDRNIVQAMVDIAQSMGKATIAEFVENQATFQLLKEYGVDYAQGFYINRPQPLDECFPSRADGRTGS